MLTRLMNGARVGFGGGQVFQIAQPLPAPIEDIISRVDVEPEPASQTDLEALSSLDAMQMYLLNADPSTEELKELRGNLLFEFGDLKMRARECCVRLAEDRRKGLEQKQEELREQGRAQKDVCIRLQNELGKAQGWHNLKNSEKHSAMTKLTQARNDRADLDRWANLKEISAADAKINKAVETYNRANDLEREALAKLNDSIGAHEEAKAIHAAMIQEDEKIKAELEGREFLPYGLQPRR